MKHRTIGICAGAFAMVLAVSTAAAQTRDVVRVRGTIAGVDGNVLDVKSELVLKYKDGEKKFVVPANVEVVMFAPGAVADLKPGEKIFVVAGKKLPDGSVEAPRVVVGRNGVNPPM